MPNRYEGRWANLSYKERVAAWKYERGRYPHIKNKDRHPLEMYEITNKEGKRIWTCEVNRCENSGCTNKKSRFFEVADYRNREGRIIFWEIMCPICGYIWYLDRKTPDREVERYKKKDKGRDFVDFHRRDNKA